MVSRLWRHVGGWGSWKPGCGGRGPPRKMSPRSRSTEQHSVTTEVNSGPSRPQPPLHVVDPPSVNVEDRRTEEARGAEQRAQVSYDREQAANTRQTETQQKYDDLHDEDLRLTRKSLEDEFELREFRNERRWDIAKKVGVGAACFVTGGLLTAAFMPRRK